MGLLSKIGSVILKVLGVILDILTTVVPALYALLGRGDGLDFVSLLICFGYTPLMLYMFYRKHKKKAQ